MVEWRGRFFRTADGLSQGFPPVSWFATLYCAMKELVFVRRLVAQRNFVLLGKLKYVCRWIDDLLGLRAELTPALKGVIAGIYPPQMKLTFETGVKVAFTDFSIRYQRSTGRYVSAVFDRRMTTKYENITASKYVHPDSDLSDMCKYGVLKAMIQRYGYICNTRQAFVFHVARLLYEHFAKGYPWGRLFLACRRALESLCPLYGIVHFEFLLCLVECRFVELCRRGIPYIDDGPSRIYFK